MISRHWRGLAKAPRADAYVEHLQIEIFPEMRKLSGFRGASIMRRAEPRGVEFLIVSEWDNLDSIRAFAGEDVEASVVPQEVREMLIEFDQVVRHYEVVDGGAR